MKKKLLLFLIFGNLILQAQTSKWSDLFSYNNVLKIREDGDRLVAATENGIFYYYPGTGEIKKLSKANGLHEVKISAFDYNATTQTGIVGYQNGSMDVITPNGIFLIIDIPLANGYNGSKRINDISINGDKAIISAGYGVSLFNITRREFGDTAFFSAGGTYEAVNSAVEKDSTVYVATDKGIKFHPINATFALYSEWNTNIISSGSFKKIDATGRITLSLHDKALLNNLKREFNTPKQAKLRKIDHFNNEFKVLDVVEGIITKIIEGNQSSLKVIVELKYGVEGSFYTSANNYKVKAGNKIRVEINKIDTLKQTVKCKIKP